MKKLIIIIIAFISIYACKDSNEFRVVVSAEGVEEGKRVLVRKLGADNKFIILDTLQVAKGKFIYKGIFEIPELHYFFIDDIRGSLPVIIEPGKINVTLYKDSINASVITGTVYNNDFNRLKADMKAISDKNAELRRRAFEARQEKDSSIVDDLRAEYEALQQEAIMIQKSFAGENPQSYVTAIVLKQLLLTNAKDVTVKEMQDMYDALPENIKATKEAGEINMQLYKIGRTAVGAVAPDFSAPTPEGEMLSLKDVKGKVTLIDFWAAWCKPCRTENPNIVALYEKYHEQGLNIIGVSLDREEAAWKKSHYG